MTRRRPAFLAVLAAGALLLAAGGCVKPGGRIAQGNRDGVLYWGNASDPQDLDPQTTIGEPDTHILNALSEPLVTVDPVDLHPVPAVAERWEVSPDGLTYTFHLRPEARWSNGDPLTARDFVESYRRILSPALGAQYAQMMFEDVVVVNAREFYEGRLKDFSRVGFSAPDPHTFVVRLAQPASYFLSMLNHNSWYPVHVPTILRFGRFDEKGTAWTRPWNYVGNGPFVPRKWVPQQEVVVERNPYYWNAANVRLKEIHYYPTENRDAEERAFRAGLLHVTYEVPLSKIDTYRRLHPELLHIDPYLGTYFYRLNVNHPALRDRRVRRALGMAIDREAIVRDVTRGGQLPAACFTPPNCAGYTARARMPYDVAAARRLLAEAGFPDGKGFPTLEVLINTDQFHRTLGEAVQEMWRRNLNIPVTIVNQEWKVYLDNMHQLNFCVARSGWIGDYNDPYSFLGTMMTGNGNNDTGFTNAEYDRLLRQATATQDTAARYELFQRAEEILLDEAPLLPVFTYSRFYLRQPSLHGWQPNLLDRHMPQFLSLDPSEEPAGVRRAPGLPLGQHVGK